MANKFAEIPAPAEPKSHVDAENFAEYKKLRTSAPPAVKADAGAIAPAVVSVPTDDKVDSLADASSANPDKKPESGTDDKKQVQEPKKGSAEARIKELTDARKQEKERADRLERELQELRTSGNRKPEPSQQTSQPEAIKPSSATIEKAKPRLAEFEKDPKYKTYAEAVDAFNDSLDTWRDEQAESRQRKADAERQSAAGMEEHNQKITKAKEAHADFEEVVQAGIAAAENIKNVGLEAAMRESEITGELVYHLASHLDEYKRICAMTPNQAYRATVALDLKLSGEPQSQVQEPKRTPVTRFTAPPPTPVGGSGGEPPARNPAETRDFDEYKRLRKAQLHRA